MQKWEYCECIYYGSKFAVTVYKVDGNSTSWEETGDDLYSKWCSTVANLGLQGWEMVGHSVWGDSSSAWWYYYFKRPLYKD